MTPFGKSVAEVTEVDLQRLIDEGWPEGRYVEFKEGVPISKEEQKRLRSSEGDQTTDRSPMNVGTLQPFGRDELLAELVAFANADGGVLILGLAETADAPARARAFNPLAAVAGLERKLRDVVVDCIEPRLPYAVVKAVQTQPDGAGILLLEIEPSRLGPHRVRTTLKAMIRREDSCVPMSMVEIHDMVLRNARRFDSLTEALNDRSTRFRKEFIDTLFSHKPPDPSGIPYTRDQFICWWFDQDSLAGVGFRVTVIPHDNLGIPRLERLDGLVPPDDFVQQDNAAGRVPLPGASVVWAAKHGGHRILGGVHQTDDQDGFVKSYVVKRDGFVDGTVVSWGQRNETRAHASWLVGLLGCVLGIYDGLRTIAGAPSMPAEIAVEILTRGGGVLTRIGGRSFREGPMPLDDVVVFPRYTVSDRPSFSEAVNEIAGDLTNAGNMGVESLPRFHVPGYHRYAVGGYRVEDPLNVEVRPYRKADLNVRIDNDPDQQSFFNDRHKSSWTSSVIPLARAVAGSLGAIRLRHGWPTMARTCPFALPPPTWR